MKIVFLDIDGVLNGDAWFARRRLRDGDLSHLDPAAVARADETAGRSGASVVVSSAWRMHRELEELRTLLRTAGLRAPVLDATPVLSDGEPDGLNRAAEILRWLERHTHQAFLDRTEAVSAFAILDDLPDFGPLAPWHVRTDPAVGLQPADVDRALALLGVSNRLPQTALHH
ncbi:MAG TPA: HAD domain-containing protein [Anaeromyxobacteraceae bacterium]|jgi:hypothetical protein|nr:HAD domain-containing protein [Anaeromyxobacteraceae bacterium]